MTENHIGPKDVAEVRFLIRMRHAWAILSTVVLLTAGAVSGWWSLRTDIVAANATASGVQAEVRGVQSEVREIRCLLRQQNEHQIYKRIPAYDCAQMNLPKPPPT